MDCIRVGQVASHVEATIKTFPGKQKPKDVMSISIVSFFKLDCIRVGQIAIRAVATIQTRQSIRIQEKYGTGIQRAKDIA